MLHHVPQCRSWRRSKAHFHHLHTLSTLLTTQTVRKARMKGRTNGVVRCIYKCWASVLHNPGTSARTFAICTCTIRLLSVRRITWSSVVQCDGAARELCLNKTQSSLPSPKINVNSPICDSTRERQVLNPRQQSADGRQKAVELGPVVSLPSPTFLAVSRCMPASFVLSQF